MGAVCGRDVRRGGRVGERDQEGVGTLQEGVCGCAQALPRLSIILRQRQKGQHSASKNLCMCKQKHQWYTMHHVS